jgi:hypothetical protein
VSPEVPPQDEHPLVARLVPDPDSPPTLVLLVGFLGPSGGDHRRLYRDAELRTWLQIPSDQIVFAQRPHNETDVWEHDVVWVERQVVLTPGRSEPEFAQTEPPLPAELIAEPAVLWRRVPAGAVPTDPGHPIGSEWPPRR